LFLGDIGIPEKVFNRIGIDYANYFDNNFIVEIS